MTHPGRHLPSLHALLDRRRIKGLTRRLRRDVLAALAREVIAREREILSRGRGLARRYGRRPHRAAIRCSDAVFVTIGGLQIVPISAAAAAAWCWWWWWWWRWRRLQFLGLSIFLRSALSRGESKR